MRFVSGAISHDNYRLAQQLHRRVGMFKKVNGPVNSRFLFVGESLAGSSPRATPLWRPRALASHSREISVES